MKRVRIQPTIISTLTLRAVKPWGTTCAHATTPQDCFTPVAFGAAHAYKPPPIDWEWLQEVTCPETLQAMQDLKLLDKKGCVAARTNYKGPAGLLLSMDTYTFQPNTVPVDSNGLGPCAILILKNKTMHYVGHVYAAGKQDIIRSLQEAQAQGLSYADPETAIFIREGEERFIPSAVICCVLMQLGVLSKTRFIERKAIDGIHSTRVYNNHLYHYASNFDYHKDDPAIKRYC